MHKYRRLIRALVLGKWPNTERVSLDLDPEFPEIVAHDVEGLELGRVSVYVGTPTEDQITGAFALELNGIRIGEAFQRFFDKVERDRARGVD